MFRVFSAISSLLSTRRIWSGRILTEDCPPMRLRSADSSTASTPVSWENVSVMQLRASERSAPVRLPNSRESVMCSTPFSSCARTRAAPLGKGDTRLSVSGPSK